MWGVDVFREGCMGCDVDIFVRLALGVQGSGFRVES